MSKTATKNLLFWEEWRWFYDSLTGRILGKTKYMISTNLVWDEIIWVNQHKFVYYDPGMILDTGDSAEKNIDKVFWPHESYFLVEKDRQ